MNLLLCVGTQWGCLGSSNVGVDAPQNFGVYGCFVGFGCVMISGKVLHLMVC